MKFSLIFTLLSTIVATEQCPAYTNPCDLKPQPGAKMTATFFSEPQFKGQSFTASVDGYFGCTNEIPPFPIRSYLSTASTKVVLHYGQDCIGHVLEDVQGGNMNVSQSNSCPGSIFIKFNRYGSC